MRENGSVKIDELPHLDIEGWYFKIYLVLMNSLLWYATLVVQTVRSWAFLVGEINKCELHPGLQSHIAQQHVSSSSSLSPTQSALATSLPPKSDPMTWALQENCVLIARYGPSFTCSNAWVTNKQIKWVIAAYEQFLQIHIYSTAYYILLIDFIQQTGTAYAHVTWPWIISAKSPRAWCAYPLLDVNNANDSL